MHRQTTWTQCLHITVEPLYNQWTSWERNFCPLYRGCPFSEVTTCLPLVLSSVALTKLNKHNFNLKTLNRSVNLGEPLSDRERREATLPDNFLCFHILYNFQRRLSSSLGIGHAL